MRNPPWNREELILALDLYFKIDYGLMHGTHPKIKALSNLLSLKNEGNGFSRSASSVSLKFANFKRIDPNFEGKGMIGGSQLEESIWQEFYQNKKELQIIASNLKSSIINQRKALFTNWLEKNGKPNGIPYQKGTISIYANQIDHIILKEFSINIEGLSLYELIDLNELKKIENSLYDGIDSKKRRDLRSAFQSYVRFVQYSNVNIEGTILGEEEDEEESYTEGKKKVYISKKAERNIKLREKAINIHGTTCKVCTFNFGKTYGSWGEGFIEVHHLIPLGGEDDKIRITDPKKNLIVLCANCHRMVHRKKGITLTVEELKQKLTTQS
ncbi:HNH endonuclease [Flavobacterium aestivum]|uniref:HNH endonuclease n=1 Tax=Flavobacterium aestivum TaxID=3003257 RepID=UPI0024832087|nr:HNH endonuclease [Flavobacterium aestivum]